MLRRAARGEGPPDLTTRATRAGSAAARAPDQDRRTTAPIAPAEARSQHKFNRPLLFRTFANVRSKAPHGFAYLPNYLSDTVENCRGSGHIIRLAVAGQNFGRLRAFAVVVFVVLDVLDVFGCLRAFSGRFARV